MSEFMPLNYMFQIIKMVNFMYILSLTKKKQNGFLNELARFE